MSTRGGVWQALERGRSIGCEAVQIFVKNNMRWFGAPLPRHDISLFAKARATHRFSCVFGHCGYLINLAAPASNNRALSIRSLLQEIGLAEQLGLPFLVLHPGSHLGAGEEAGLRQVAAGLDAVLAETKRVPVRVALENTAGQGTCLGGRLEHLADIFDLVRTPERLGICLDTAHLFAGGYDIRTAKGWEAVVRRVKSLLGLKQVLAFHLNDSRTELGSRVDRHAHIGQGKIGKAGFRHIVNDERFKRTPACLETPKSDDLREDVQNLQVLRALEKRR